MMLSTDEIAGLIRAHVRLEWRGHDHADLNPRSVTAAAEAIAARVAPEGAGGSLEAFREACAAAVERHDKAGREWVPGSLWDTLAREAAARIRAVPLPAMPASAGAAEMRETAARLCEHPNAGLVPPDGGAQAPAAILTTVAAQIRALPLEALAADDGAARAAQTIRERVARDSQVFRAGQQLAELARLFTEGSHAARDALNAAGLPCPGVLALAAERARNLLRDIEGEGA